MAGPLTEASQRKLFPSTASPARKPRTASMATRPCVTSASRYRLRVLPSAFSASPRGSKISSKGGKALRRKMRKGHTASETLSSTKTAPRVKEAKSYPGSSSMVSWSAVENVGMEAGAKAAAEPARARTEAAIFMLDVVWMLSCVCCVGFDAVVFAVCICYAYRCG